MFDFVKLVKNVFTTSVPDTSPAVTVDKTDGAKLVRTSTLVGIAAALSYAVTNIDPSMFGPYQPIIMLGITVVLDFVNKLVKSN